MAQQGVLVVAFSYGYSSSWIWRFPDWSVLELAKRDLTELAPDKSGAVPRMDPFGFHTQSNPSGVLHIGGGQRNAVGIHH